jgi:hypothetical protein
MPKKKIVVNLTKILKFGEARGYGSKEVKEGLRKRLEDMSVVK